MAGLVNVPLSAAYQDALPADARGNGMAVLNTAGYAVMTVVSLVMAGLARAQIVTAGGQLWIVAGLAGMGAVVAWRTLRREFLEQAMEILLWPLYRIRAWPGKYSWPKCGPLIVIANHTAYLDPLWLGKVVPRRLRPMMTSVFYDVPILRFLMTYFVHAIRVPAAAFRRQAPELKDAVAALDEQECLVIFPEGMLRRRADQPLRPFGQGIWHILRERPKTPVVVCWIEGGWGSYWSYCDGPPLKNKPMDFWRRIRIAVAEPQVLEPALLTDHRRTRIYLRQTCIKMRDVLGLPPFENTRISRERPGIGS